MTPSKPEPDAAAHEVVAPADLEAFLRRHPWTAEQLSLGRPVEHFWVLDVAMPKHALWPHLVDTSTMNRRLGLPEMRFVERDGKTFGSQVRGGATMEWEEVPWEWDYERGLQNARIYAAGALRYLRARFEVHDRGDDACAVVVYFGGIPRTWIGWLALRFGMRGLGGDMKRVFDSLAEAHHAKVPPRPAARVEPLTPEAMLRLREILAAIVAEGTSRAVADRIESFVIGAADDELARIRVRALARAWDLPERDVVSGFLHATRRGLFTLSWDAICPHCRGSRVEISHLGELPRVATCAPCGIDFDATQMDSLEVSFRVHPSVRRAERRQFCAAEPARRPHIFIQRTLPAGGDATIPLGLGEGRYRLRARGSKDCTLLDVRADASAREVLFRGDVALETLVVAPSPVFRFENPREVPATFVLERRDADAEALRPSDLFSLQDFRDLFSQEAVAADVQLDIGMQTILFTDIVGSTRYYEVVGDGKAFAQVRRHFLKAYDCVKRHRGVVVKTIGDAVMGAFQDPAGAVEAAIELQRIFDGTDAQSPLRLRVTIHAGHCLAVSLNSNIDYFGSTVNLAAKLQSLAGAGEVAFTETIRDDPGVVAVMAREGFLLEPVPFEMKWSGERLEAYRIDVSGARTSLAPSR